MSGNQLKLGNLSYTKAPPTTMAHVRNNAALAKQIKGVLTQSNRQGILAEMQAPGGHGFGAGASGTPATKNERNAATYNRFSKEYNALAARAVKGNVLTKEEQERLSSLPTLMAQYAPKLGIAAPGGFVPRFPGNLPSPGKSRRNRRNRKSRKQRRRSRKN